MTKDTFNDKMVKRTVVPVIYLWMLASGAVVGMGIFSPDVVLANLDGFIALIALIGGTASKPLRNILRMWDAEQVAETTEVPINSEHRRDRLTEEHQHQMSMESRLERAWPPEAEE